MESQTVLQESQQSANNDSPKKIISDKLVRSKSTPTKSKDDKDREMEKVVISVRQLSLNPSDNGPSFNLTLVCEAFLKSIDDRSAIVIDLYLQAFSELVKFFNLFGTLFTFISKDVQAKIEILEAYATDEKCGCHYQTVQSMIDFEKESKLLKDHKRPSGARTLLRLHRALQFISTFLSEVTKLDDDHSTSSAAKVAYQGTLSKYHPWLVRQTVQVALYALPYRRVLIERVYGGKDRIPDGGSNEVNKNMTHLSNIADEVFRVTDKLYEEHNLHDLP